MQSFLDQIVYFGYFQSIFLLIIYSVSAKKRRSIDGYLAVFVLILTISLTGRIIYISEIFGKNFRFIVFSEFSTLLFGATVYLFTRSSLKNKPFTYRDLRHYVPGLVYIILVVLVFMIPSDEVISARSKSGELFRTISLFVAIGLSFNITYWILSFQIFIKVKKQLNDELSYAVKTQFFFNFLIGIGFCLLCWTTIYFISLAGFETIERSSRQFIWLGIALIILFIAYYSMTEPELFKVTSNAKRKKYTQSKLSGQELELLKVKLEQLMADKKPYLNSKLLKAELAEMLGVSNPEIARLLNENIGMNFFEYVNYYRIKEFVELSKTEKAKSLTFFGLAQEAGFNSKTTFNKSFKKLMGTSPKEYFTSQA